MPNGLRLIVILAAATVAVTPSPSAGRPFRAAPPLDAPTATLSVRHEMPGAPSVVEVRLTPRDAAGGGELFLSLTKPDPDRYLKKRRVLAPAAPGVYRLEYTFPESGIWYFYVRYGPGQAGFYAVGPVDVEPRPGGEDTFTMRMRRGLSAGVPVWVQPLGYAAFGVIAVLALAGVIAILSRLRRMTGASAPRAA